MMHTVPLLLALLALLSAPGLAQDAPRRPPNVILFLADDLGYGEVGCYGQERIRTPNLDRLAAEGLRFTRAYAGHPVCAPSRCVLLTGLHTGHAEIRANSPWASRDNPYGEGQEPLPEGATTLSTLLGARGYATGCFGKWGLGGPGTSGAPTAQGFERFFGYLCQKQAHDYYPAHLWRDGEQVALANSGFTESARCSAAPDDPSAYAAFAGEDYAPDLVLSEALAFVREQAGEPFLLYYPTNVPHASLQVPEDSLAEYLDMGWDDAPYLGDQGYLPHRAPRAAYAAMVTRMDRDLGRLVTLIEELDLARDTLVLFASDNGPTYNGGTDSRFFESTAGLRGLKGSLYEGGVRVPLVAWWPGSIAPGRSCDAPVGFQDVLPTLVELAGGDAPEGLDGVSLAPLLRSPHASLPPRELYWETRRAQALVAGDWKLVRRRPEEGADALELYDLARDPAEARNLAADEPERAAELLRRLEAARVPSARFPSAFDAP